MGEVGDLGAVPPVGSRGWYNPVTGSSLGFPFKYHRARNCMSSVRIPELI